MSIEEIRKNAPDGATHYIILSKNIHYIKKINDKWHVAYNYDCGSGWAILNVHFIGEPKPLN